MLWNGEIAARDTPDARAFDLTVGECKPIATGSRVSSELGYSGPLLMSPACFWWKDCWHVDVVLSHVSQLLFVVRWATVRKVSGILSPALSISLFCTESLRSDLVLTQHVLCLQAAHAESIGADAISAHTPLFFTPGSIGEQLQCKFCLLLNFMFSIYKLTPVVL